MGLGVMILAIHCTVGMADREAKKGGDVRFRMTYPVNPGQNSMGKIPKK